MQRLSKALSRQEVLFARLKIPQEVKLESIGPSLTVSGALGSIQTDLSKLDTAGCAAIQVLPESRELAIACCDKAFFGTIQTLIQNKIKGVTEGYIKYLKIQGIGYRAILKDGTLMMKLGFSHDVAYTLPPSLKAFLPDPTTIGIYGIEKNQVTQAAANIRALRPPSVYKGKGIRYIDEEVKLKSGKKK